VYAPVEKRLGSQADRDPGAPTVGTPVNRSIRLAALFALAACSGAPSAPDASAVCATLLCGKECCAQGQTCDPLGACCTPVDCLAEGRECGDDGCGTPCGTCGTGMLCNSGFRCAGCLAETDAAFCLRLGKTCGQVTGLDNCLDSRTVADCGTCTNGRLCGTDNLCSGACVPLTHDEFCHNYGKNCGPFTALDNCAVSRTENCGTCPGGGTCTNNVCP
jgi:hypothetical protein